jgi:hypothetical protein
MFRVTEISYHCPENTSEGYAIKVVLGVCDTAPMPELRHPIDQWWVASGATHRTRMMTGSVVRGV